MGQAKEKGVGCLWIYPFVAAENVEGFEAKGILISPMYIYNKNAAAYWGIGWGMQSKIVATSTTNAIYKKFIMITNNLSV